ncbi:NADP-specific glutamate dehydrogenase [Fulvivirga sp. RKSG066]|uniref:NADP-specific glutamate dehydrogenase n=1 Tax=Fulvivirga aurantia TaxID=2529383 RepID=UPI0012BB587C|nr:NADP-specific glutamate dehydrogenase [Fulvivirga aurantia]MTI22415.1 NADP-specific glutamate dehydrogenase [Fulvivirga aurantia]
MSEILENIKDRNPGEPEFHQAAEEVIDAIKPVLDKNPKYRKHKIIERMLEPERVVSFRVTWMDDNGEIQINRGYRVQMNSAIGPYKGGLRFHPSVYPGILKFLAFEQIFKNALTGLPMGGGKGGSDFNPKGKSDAEVMRFCQNFFIEMTRHIGHRVDVPAGDIGVGAREIGYMFGTHKRLTNEFTGVLTGKGVGWGGSLMRTEATGYGLIYFAQNMLEHKDDSMEDKVCLISGSGNVAQHAIEKILHMGGKPVTASDSSGYIYDEEGITQEKLDFIKDLKNNKRGRIKEYVDEYSSAEYHENKDDEEFNPLWDIKADCAFPCATQNEVNLKDAENMVKNGVKLIGEGANMPLIKDAIDHVLENDVLYSPGKASNAGGVATSGIEMMQNYLGSYFTSEEVDNRLKNIMKDIHENCLSAAEEYGHKDNYMIGANISGFIKVADAMIAQGVI